MVWQNGGVITHVNSQANELGTIFYIGDCSKQPSYCGSNEIKKQSFISTESNPSGSSSGHNFHSGVQIEEVNSTIVTTSSSVIAKVKSCKRKQFQCEESHQNRHRKVIY